MTVRTQPETKRATTAARTDPEDRSFPSGAIRKTLERCASSATWRSHLGIDGSGDVRTSEDFRRLPFMTKASFRNAAPLAFSCAPERDIVRIHSTSGTTGEPVIVPYTAGDVAVFREIMARCLRIAGVGPEDRVQITPGYGLWTAGIGFQAGVEEIGAMAVPLGPQPLPKQLEFMRRLRPTVLIGTASFAFLVGEEMARSGSRPPFRIAILGAEQWGEKRRGMIEALTGAETFDIYGMTETYGPGISIDCPRHEGLHYWDDLFYFEVVDDRGNVLPDGEPGELVVTTLAKEGMPLVRYRTGDRTTLLRRRCSCGSRYPLMARVDGRTDDMITFRGVNIYPSAVEVMLSKAPGLSCEYRITLRTEEGRDVLTLEVEGSETGAHPSPKVVEHEFKALFSATPVVEILTYGTLERAVKKAKRVADMR